MQTSKRILGVGRVVLDHVVVLPSYPACDTKCLVSDHWRQMGGPVPVALSTAQRYGIATEFLGVWGDDTAGREIAETLSQRGIGTTHCQRNGKTGFAQIWTEQDTGRRTIAAHPGAELGKEELDSFRKAAQACDILVLDGSSGEVALALTQQVKAQGGRVVLDAGSKKPGTAALLPWVDVLIASDLFCGSWFGTSEVTFEALLQLGCTSVVRTQGALGATYCDGEQTIHEDAQPVQAVDTNGAGDIFCGAWLRGMAEGWDTRRTLAFANRVAGFSCQFRGNTTLPED